MTSHSTNLASIPHSGSGESDEYDAHVEDLSILLSQADAHELSLIDGSPQIVHAQHKVKQETAKQPEAGSSNRDEGSSMGQIVHAQHERKQETTKQPEGGPSNQVIQETAKQPEGEASDQNEESSMDRASDHQEALKVAQRLKRTQAIELALHQSSLADSTSSRSPKAASNNTTAPQFSTNAASCPAPSTLPIPRTTVMATVSPPRACAHVNTTATRTRAISAPSCSATPLVIRTNSNRVHARIEPYRQDWLYAVRGRERRVYPRFTPAVRYLEREDRDDEPAVLMLAPGIQAASRFLLADD